MPDTKTSVRRAGATLAAAAVVLTLTACGEQDVTKARIENSLPPTFANLYAQRAAILGEIGVTPAKTAAKATCDRGGPKVADVGPGADWICMVAFIDDKGKAQTGKFELQVKANSTYVAGGPTKLVGLVTITDKRTGNDVPNSAFEFDGAFDPNG